MRRDVIFEMSSGKSLIIEWIDQKTEMDKSVDEILHEMKEYLQAVDDLHYFTELDSYRMNPRTVLVNKNNIEKIWIEEF